MENGNWQHQRDGVIGAARPVIISCQVTLLVLDEIINLGRSKYPYIPL